MPRDGSVTPDKSGYDMGVLGKSYNYGAWMYERSRIARNQIEALNIKIHMAVVKDLKDDPKLQQSMKELEVESKKLIEIPEAVTEWRLAHNSWVDKETK